MNNLIIGIAGGSGSGENTTAIEMLAHHIRSLIEKANML